MRALITFAALIWALPVLADGAPSDADIAAFVAVAEARGCVIESPTDPTLLADTKLSADVVMQAARALIAQGKAAVVADKLHLLTANCPALADSAKPAKPTPTPDRAAFIAALEANGCKMTKAEANVLLPKAGFTPQSSGPIVQDLIAEGLAVVDDTTFTLKTGKCH